VSVTSGTTTTRFVYGSDGRVLAEYGAAATNIVAEHIWLTPDAANDNGATSFGGDDGAGGYAPLAIATGTTLNWVHSDHLGVPVAYTNTAGASVTIPHDLRFPIPAHPAADAETLDYPTFSGPHCNLC
jgi:hypothetical protein